MAIVVTAWRRACGGRSQHGGAQDALKPLTPSRTARVLRKRFCGRQEHLPDTVAIVQQRARIASSKNCRLVQVPTAFSGLAMGSALEGRNVLFLNVNFRERFRTQKYTSSALGGKQNQVERAGTLARSGAFETRSRGPNHGKG